MHLDTIRVTGTCKDMEAVGRLAREAFPPEEYLPPDKLVDMQRDGRTDFWALYDRQTFVGFMVVRTHGRMAYLFFLAIEPRLRSHGYGGRAIETLTALYPGMEQVVDLEMLDDGAENREQRERRRAFYLRCGYRPTGHFLSYFGVDYEVLCMDEGFDFPLFQEMMGSLPVEGFSPVYFTRE